MIMVERICGCEGQRFPFRGVIVAVEAKERSGHVEADFALPGCERLVGFGAADEDDIVRAQFLLGNFKIFANRHGAFVAIQEFLLKLFGGVAVGARIGKGTVHQQGGSQAAVDIGRYVHRAARIRRHRKLHTGRSEERLRGNCFGGVRAEEVRHQMEEAIVAEIVPQLIQKNRAFMCFQIEAFDRIQIGAAAETAVTRPMRGHFLGERAGLEIAIVSGGAGDEPDVGIGGGQHPSLP